ncbi:aminotransferase class I/II-fold pyridoxal phosphate-dependent enzyme [Spongiivirga sp. MCCC 1A20706]|uniref:DegT/DnrJ/EryC1/StrS family aminotransferase n=1 Tax=Spongiivirga sp. MCCC 1A20706 TaxID=3160963 RepID=UPI00397731E4
MAITNTKTNAKIWLSSPHMSGNERNFVNDAFDTNWVAPLGPNVNGFEKDIEAYLGEGIHAAALVSGTSAIHLGLILLGVTSGDEVVCQSMTFSASANPIAYQGATPIFVDSERLTGNMDPEQLEIAIKDRMSNGIKPKAIIAVHLYGMPYQVDKIHTIAKKYDIPVLEDSAESLGSLFQGINCGTFGDIAILSFNGNKIITTSGGGALLTKSEALKERAVYLSTQARDNAIHYQHSEVGYNYRMSNVIAGIGRGQIQVLDNRVEARRANYDFYVRNLKGYDEIEFIDEPDGYFSNRWLSAILTSSYELREQIRLALLAENIESRPLWKPMHLQPVFNNAPSYTNGVSEDLFLRGLCLPSGSNLDAQDLEKVVSIIKSVLNV